MSFPRYPTYKASGVEWLGEVPAHWALPSVRRLLARIEQGWSPECDARPAEPGEWGVLKAGCVNRGAFDPNENKALPSDKEPQAELEVRPGDLLMSRASGSPELVGSTALVRASPRRLMLSDKIFRLHSANDIQPAFLAWAFGSRPFRHQIERAISGGDGLANNLPQSALLGFVCPCPSLAEQLAIAAFLDRETAKIDALVAEQQRLIELLKEKRQAVISRAVTKGLDPNAKMKPSGIEWLGEVPVHWQTIPLGAVLSAAPCYGVLVPDFDAEGVPMVRVMDIEDGRVNLETVTRISERLSDEYSRTLLSKGDVVLSVVGTIGVAMSVDSDLEGANLSRALARLQVGEHLSAEFLCRWFESTAFATFIDVTCVGSAQRVLNMSDLRAMRLMLPPRAEQDRITDSIRAGAGAIDRLSASAEHAIALLQERRTSLISAAVTGQIDVRAWEAR